MILLPIGRDDSEIRRHAWVSYILIALNIVAFVAVETAQRQAARELNATWSAAVSYLVAHPYLDVPPEMAPVLGPRGEQYLAQVRTLLKKNVTPPVMKREQEKLNTLARNAWGTTRSLPTHRFGYVPKDGGFLQLVTHMFVHAGFLHLLGNLLFFFLSGPFVEDVFGRPLFAAMYVIGGFTAALTYAGQHAGATIPLVGASGAIAAVMGAYLVRFLRSKIEFLFVPFLLRPMWHFRFFMPAFVVLPLWFVQQFWQMRSEDSGSGIAFSAHVGGFVFGVVVALVVKLVKFEEKYVHPVVEKQTTWAMDDRVIAALDAQKFGDHATALQQVAAVLRDDRNNVDALRIAVDSAVGVEDAAAVDGYGTRLLNRYIEEKQTDMATDLVYELTADPDAKLPKFVPRAAMFAERNGNADLAMTLYERAVAADPNAPAAVASLVKIGTMLRARGDVAAARETFTRARRHPACTAEWAPTIDARLAQLGVAVEQQGETPWA
ncbi:MAG TPA: rhomboid family intramembrane serine protease [Thermoanaerobaculia bacterium]|nr:rhomboid family intramembrane serine protease [Thermoanaerobaculia bacterium]